MTVLACYEELGDYSGMPIPGFDTEFTTHWIVKTDTVADNPATIYATGLLPAKYAAYSDNFTATVRDIRFRREQKAPWIWHVTVHYSSRPVSEEERERATKPNPENRDAAIEWESSPYQKPVFMSIDDVTIMNSAGDLPENVPSKTDYYSVATVTKNVVAVPAWMRDYAGKINSDTFTIDGESIPPKHARLVILRLSKKLREGTYIFRPLTMGFEFRVKREARYSGETIPDPFDLELQDEGLNEWNDVTLKKTVIMTDDDNPRPVSRAVLLDGFGKKLANPSLSRAVFKAWPIIETRPFAGLPLT